MRDPTRVCGNCDAYRPDPQTMGKNKQGWCQAGLPTVFPVQMVANNVLSGRQEATMGFQSSWPPVQATAWCRDKWAPADMDSRTVEESPARRLLSS